MDFDTCTNEEAERFVLLQKDYLNERFLNFFKVGVKEIYRNPRQTENRRKLYDVVLSNDRTCVLKFVSKKNIQKEIQGRSYANSVGINALKLYDGELDSNNPFHSPFVVIEHFEEDPARGFVTRSSKEGGKRIDYRLAIEFIDDVVGVLYKLHNHVNFLSSEIFSEISGGKIGEYFDMYNGFDINRLYHNYKKKILKKVSRRDRQDLLLERVDDLMSYFIRYKEFFKDVNCSFLHGDLVYGNYLNSKKGIVLLDWENLNIGDSAEDIAYFIYNGGFVEPKSQIDDICRLYSTNDEGFKVRLEYHYHLLSLDKVLDIPNDKQVLDSFLHSGLKPYLE